MVEAKANIQELRSFCKAEAEGGRPLIARSLAAVKSTLGVPEDRDWLNGYYQYCNRIAVFRGEIGIQVIFFAGRPGLPHSRRRHSLEAFFHASRNWLDPRPGNISIAHASYCDFSLSGGPSIRNPTSQSTHRPTEFDGAWFCLPFGPFRIHLANNPRSTTTSLQSGETEK